MASRAHGYRWVCLAAVLLIAGCAEHPRYALMSPIAQAKVYGYAETAKGARRYTVTYATPVLTSSSPPDVQDREAEVLRTQALDFALWRAALIAEAAGYEGFRVADKRTDLDTLPEPAYYDRGFYGPWRGGGVGVDAFGFNRGMGVGAGAGLGYTAPPASPYTHRRARASVEIEFVGSLAPGDYRVADVLAQVQRAYPTATQAPPQP